jgi:hypothetical protein
MKRIFQCRRSSLALLGMVCLTWLGLAKDADVALAIAGIVGSVAASNAYQKRPLEPEKES